MQKAFSFLCVVGLMFLLEIPIAFAQAPTPAILFFVPATISVVQGQSVWVTVMVNTGGQAINAAAASFSYPVDTVEVVEVSTAGSEILTTIVAPPVFGGGKAKAAGGSQIGVSGIKKVASFRIQAKKSSGVASLQFLQDSAVVRKSDSSNIVSLVSSIGATVNLQVPVVPTPLPSPVPSPQPSPLPPSPPPVATFVISDIKAEEISQGRVLLSWKTSEPTRISVHYGPASEEEYAFSILDNALTQDHSVVLSEVESSKDYSLEISGVDERGYELGTQKLVLAELFKKKGIPELPLSQNIEIGGFEFRPAMLVLFVGLPIFVILLVVFLVLRRRS